MILSMASFASRISPHRLGRAAQRDSGAARGGILLQIDLRGRLLPERPDDGAARADDAADAVGRHIDHEHLVEHARERLLHLQGEVLAREPLDLRLGLAHGVARAGDERHAGAVVLLGELDDRG